VTQSGRDESGIGNPLIEAHFYFFSHFLAKWKQYDTQISNNQNNNDLASVPLFPPKMVLTFCKTNAGEK